MARTSCSTSGSNSSRERGSAFAAALSSVSVTADTIGGAAEVQEHVKSDELMGLGVQHELHAALHFQFLIDIVQVDLDRAFGNAEPPRQLPVAEAARDRKSTRLNSSHGYISYAVFCLKKKKTYTNVCTNSND